MSKESAVNNIISEINDVLKKHLVSIIEKNKNDKDGFENFIKNLPFIKNIIEENKLLKQENEMHKKQVVFLNNNLASLSKKYTELFFKNNKLIASVHIKNVEKTENNDKSNIELIVDDTKSERTDIDENDIIKEVEENLEKKRNQMEKTSVYLNNYELDEEKTFSAEEMKEDIEVKKILITDDLDDGDLDDCVDFHKSILLAQKAGDYATIDTASDEGVVEEDEEVVEEEEEEDEKDDVEEEDEEEDEKDDVEEEDEKDDEKDDEEEEEEEDEKDDEEVEEEEEDEEEVVEIDFEGSKYYGNEEAVGKIYEYLEDGDIGDEVGHYVNGLPIIF